MSDKFKSLVHYVLSCRADRPDTLGAVKLNKILWMSDLSAFYKTGQPITNSRYIKQEFGPVPARILPTVRDLQNEGKITVAEASHYGLQKKVYRVNVHRDDSFLTPEEKQIVDDSIEYVCDAHTAKSVSEITHDHIWQAAEVGEELPLFTVFSVPGKITNIEREWAKLTLQSEMETEAA